MEAVKLNNDMAKTSPSVAVFFLPQDRRDAFQGQGMPTRPMKKYPV